MVVKRVGRLGTALAVAAFSLQAGAVARADTAPIADSPDLPWTNPAHQSSLEVLASQIASVIANRPVTIRCEGDTDWRTLVRQGGGDVNSELGYVGATFSASSGRVVSISGSAELAGGKVCLPLKRFAVATTKPTKCLSVQAQERTVVVTKRVAVKKTVVVGGKHRVRTTWVTRRAPVGKVTENVLGPPTSCYPWGGAVQDVPNSFWDDYQSYAIAILTLAHESIHLGGVVGSAGRTASNGSAIGDPLAEAKANCYGMQWMPYVAAQLGDTPDDAQAITEFFWTVIYPRYQSSAFSQYWSADCRPGGALDLKLPGATVWP